MKIDRSLFSGRMFTRCGWAFLVLLLMQSSAFAQIRLVLSLAPELRNAQILRVSDFNITGSGSVSRLFDLRLTNIPRPMSVILRFQLTSDRFPAAPIVTAVSRPIAVTPPIYTLTYDELKRRSEVDYNDTAVKEITDAILQTGKLPGGSYTFTLSVADAQQPGVQQDTRQETLTISNPTTLDLISPGAPVGSGECAAQFGLLPQFKWSSNADRFLLTVCEVLPGNSSPEDVMQNQPRLQRIVQRGIDFAGSPSFMYPPAEQLPLQFGKTYYWQIQAIINSPSGETRLPGEIWCFQINSISNPGSSMLLQQLLNLLGSGDLTTLFDDGGPLHGFTPTGAVSMNGRRMELVELLNLLRTQPIKPVAVQVE
jgi:hypothetical protein